MTKHILDTSNAIVALEELIDVFLGVDLNSPLAKLNETTISDNNGGRIEL